MPTSRPCDLAAFPTRFVAYRTCAKNYTWLARNVTIPSPSLHRVCAGAARGIPEKRVSEMAEPNAWCDIACHWVVQTHNNTHHDEELLGQTPDVTALRSTYALA